MGLLAVVVYLYTVVAFNFFRKFYNKSEDEDEPDMKCDDMMTVSMNHTHQTQQTSVSKGSLFTSSVCCAQCYLFHMYVGVRAGGGIGDEIEDPAGDPYELYRILFDITFFFFVIVILLAIIQGKLRMNSHLKHAETLKLMTGFVTLHIDAVFTHNALYADHSSFVGAGLIIDAFGELRDQQEQVKEDMEVREGSSVESGGVFCHLRVLLLYQRPDTGVFLIFLN